ncbi:MAG TPA: hypothetical protein VH186_34585 [Chloroflexia bacterium]|nr:hypothetical protein [Chloroflexia bacterium]
MARNNNGGGLRERGGLIIIGLGVLVILVALPVLLLANGLFQPKPELPTATPAPTATVAPPPLPVSPSPTPTPTLPPRTVSLSPEHGIHAPIGNQWTDPQRKALTDFKDSTGLSGAPGSVVALSADMLAANNATHTPMEQDLWQYARQGSQIYVRMYPQRFPGGFSEDPANSGGRNTISGTPQDAANDIFEFVSLQQRRNSWHFTRIIPGNEPDLEWPDDLYGYNLLSWHSNGDPNKYFQINRFYVALYKAWQNRLAQPDAAPFRDVTLYFPPLAQDGTPGSQYYAAFNYYDAANPVGNRYDALREAVELYGRVAWHNYFQPGHACQDVAANFFPDWLRKGLQAGWPAVIGEAGWAPTSLALPAQNDSRARIAQFWQLLKVKWELKLYQDDRPKWQTYDARIDGVSFEDDLQRFTSGCYKGGLTLSQPVAIAVWLAGSEGNFEAALGVEPGAAGVVRRWFQAYANRPF